MGEEKEEIALESSDVEKEHAVESNSDEKLLTWKDLVSFLISSVFKKLSEL